MNTTNASLLQLLRSPGAEPAWDKFVDLYTPLLYYWARSVGLKGPDAADLVQEVFLVLVRKLPEFEYERHKSFRGWLRTVTLNKWRELHRRKALPLDTDAQRVEDLALAADSTAFEEVEYRQFLVSRVLEIIEVEFPPLTWKAFWEYVILGRPAAEVAKELNLREGSVYSIKCRVLTRLRQHLEGLLD